MKPMAYRLVAMLFALGLCFTSLQVSAAEKSLADKKIVLQISDSDPFKQTLVLNVATNLKKLYGPDLVDVEIVAFGPGLRLLQEGNANTPRIKGLVENGVRFSACAQTIKKMTAVLGEEPALNPDAVVVSGGVVRILDLTGQGYVLVKP